MVCSLVSIYFNSLQLGIKNNLYKTLDYWSRDMLHFDFLEKSLGSFPTTFCVWYFKKNVPHIILLIELISMSDFLYFLRHWAICVLHLFALQVVTYILKLTLSFYFSYFSTWPKSQEKKANILGTKRAFKLK